jgi:hypothetical protein
MQGEEIITQIGIKLKDAGRTLNEVGILVGINIH